MKWLLTEISKKKNIQFQEKLELTESLKERSKEVLDMTVAELTGQVSYDDGIFMLDYKLEVELILPSSRSLAPVKYPMEIFVSEAFSQDQSMISTDDSHPENMIFFLEGDSIDLDESVIDNIILEIPLRILTEEEEKDDQSLPSGNNWQVISEERFAELKEEQKLEKKNAFSALDGFLDK